METKTNKKCPRAKKCPYYQPGTDLCDVNGGDTGWGTMCGILKNNTIFNLSGMK